ncbi:MerC domain-containing protein [Pararhodonellum marinum]|uniref:MerC domain-containing protein n=1 Tax=Pararhodonellum marinum TaxID=2755358 RepID=UPI00188EB7B4|nr:MerC domain-containing protein [Pararhodonellum marinum]
MSNIKIEIISDLLWFIYRMVPIFATMLHKIKTTPISFSDLFGISASFLCLIHCLAVPVLLTMGYVLQFPFGINHEIWDLIFIVLAVMAVYFSTKKHSNGIIKICLWSIVLVFSVSVLVHEWIPGMVNVSIGSSIALIFLHIINWNNHRGIKVISK